jgi:ubiquitin C-terminal hydrolase
VPLTADEYWKQYYSKNNSHITDLFYGLVVMQDTCVECKKSFKKFEPISSLYLPIKYQEDAVSLEECVSAYFAREEIPNFHCQACNTRSMAIRYTFLHRGPEILVLRINRDFNRHGSGKVDTPIDMETDILDLGRFAHAEAGTSSPFRMTYRLYATCNHYGSVQTGHYTAHSRHKPIINDKGEQALSRWYRFDDDKVYEQASKVPPKSAIEPYEVYIMFFQLLPDGLSDGQRRLSKELWNMPRSPVSDSPH